MKKISIDKFRDYPFDFSLGLSFFPNNIAFFYPKPLFIIFTSLIGIVCLFNYRALIFFVPLVVVNFYQYLSLKKAKSGLKVKRKFSARSKEGNSELTQWEISNPYDFTFSNLVLKDKFIGERVPKGKKGILLYFEELKSRFRFKYQRKLILNNGMGKKPYGPMTIFFSDTLGLHQLKFVHDTEEYMHVFPKVYPVQAPRTKPHEQSIEYGLYDSTTRGENINFYQTREYREGDSINKINWKLTVKSHKVIVNEFENNSNSRINIILNDDHRIHNGDGAFSTFEYAKDMALSLCHHHINSNDSIGLICHQKYIQPKSGKNHLVALELFASNLEMSEFPAADLYHKSNKIPLEVQRLEKKINNLLKENSNTYIISGFIPGKLWRFYLDLFKTTARKSLKTHITLIDGISYLIKNSELDNQLWLAHLKESYPQAKAEFEIFCKKNAITFRIIEIDPTIEESHRIKDAFKRQ